MPQDAYTLRHIARELDAALAGGKVNKIIQPSRDEVDILLYAGGNLVVGKVPVEEIERRYKAMGFDRAFGPGTDPQVTIDCLKKDFGIE